MILPLSIAVLISAIVAIYAKTSANKSLEYFFKPLTMLAIISLTLINISSPPTFYQKMIIAGLILSTIGDVFLINQERFFVYGLLSFLLGHFCYIAAFWTTPHLPSATFYLIYTVFFLIVLWKHLGKLKIPVVVYALTLAWMSWLAFSLYSKSNDDKFLLAFLGSVVFLASDSLLAYNKFRKPFSLAHPLILATYFLAQWLIALSI